MGISGQMLEMLFISNDDRGKGTGESLSIVIYEKSILSLARKWILNCCHKYRKILQRYSQETGGIFPNRVMKKTPHFSDEEAAF